MSGYLFAFFTGEKEKNGEQIYFALSKDGLHWNDLGTGEPILTSHIGTKGVRDPFLVRDERNGKFYLLATDLCIGNGTSWENAQYAGSRDLILWESDDLVHWGSERAITLGTQNAGCVWAPECIYDEEKEAFFIFWASMTKEHGEENAKQRIYSTYTKDFKNFSESILYLERENHVIDMNIVKEGGWYYRFVKNETSKLIEMDRVKHLMDTEAEIIPAEALKTVGAAEGPEAYRLSDNRWCLIVDQFAAGTGYLPLLCSDLSSGEFTIADAEDYDLGRLRKRHGSVMAITDAEAAMLQN